MELPRRTCGSRASALARIPRTRKTVARRPCAYLPLAPDALLRWEWHRHLDFQHVSRFVSLKKIHSIRQLDDVCRKVGKV